MGMNISKGNMYEFVTHTWNTIKGKCYHNCSYCYMKRWGELKDVRFDKKELKTDLGEGNFIFVGSSCDMFNDKIPTDWIWETMGHIYHHNNNKYLFQSKNTIKMAYEILPVVEENWLFCTTLESNRFIPEIMKHSPKPQDRVVGMQYFKDSYLTIEPIMDFDMKEFVGMIKDINPIQVNIGADTGYHNLPEPDFGKVKELVEEISSFTTIHKKRNLARLSR